MASLAGGETVPVIAARYAVQAAPDASTVSLSTGRAEVVRALVAYAGTVTDVVVQLWIRNARTGGWHRAATSDDLGPLTPENGNEVMDWYVGSNVECTFTVSSISPGTSGNTVAVDALEVNL